MYTMKKYKWITCLWVCLLSVSGVLLTACDSDDKDNSVSLNVFGPSPALRGGELRFIGNNLDQVQSIVLYGLESTTIEVTDITVVDEREIKIIIPQDAAPGYVTLKTPQGDITTITELTFSEPIVLEDFSPKTVKAGDVLVITGDYLNLIQEIIFVEDVTVDAEAFVSQSREKLEVIVPFEAQSGKFRISNGAEIPIEIYSEEELVVTLPTITKIAPSPVKAGEVLTVTGTDLELAAAVRFAGEVEAEEFDLNENNTEIYVIVPYEAQEGALTLITKSGLEVESTSVITLVTLTDLVISPEVGIRAGDRLTITGNNLDLVTTVVFAGEEEEITPDSQSETQLNLTVPEMAVSGEVILNIANGSYAIVEIATLKPVVNAYSTSSIAMASDIVFSGTDLDLVTGVVFGNSSPVEVSTNDPSTLVVTVPVDAETGNVILLMNNSETVECPVLNVVAPVVCYVVNWQTDEIYAGDLLIVEVANVDKLTSIQVEGNTAQYIREGNKLRILIPSGLYGEDIDLTFVSSNGEITYKIEVLQGGVVETVIFTGPVEMTWSDGGRVHLSMSDFENLTAGAILKIAIEQNDNWGQIQINNGSWNEIVFSELGGGTLTTDNIGDKSVTEVELILTQDILDNIRGTGSEDAIIMQGSDMTVTSVSIITGR